jgi:hypothetical protein
MAENDNVHQLNDFAEVVEPKPLEAFIYAAIKTVAQSASEVAPILQLLPPEAAGEVLDDLTKRVVKISAEAFREGLANGTAAL